jgi:hypothetical protein
MRRAWLARLCIGLVLFANLECAVVFLWQPQAYAPSFELDGAVGATVIRALGVLFIMWNVPYAVALWQPVRQRISLWEAMAMQTIGLLGEAAIWLAVGAEHDALHAALGRFMLFDGLGVTLLLAALAISRRTAAPAA